MATAKDIAEKAGVSRGTVDRALHGRDGINKDVREHILKIAAELGYTPDRAGKALRLKTRNIKIGIVYPGPKNPFFEMVLSGARQAENELCDFNLRLLIRPTEHFSAGEQLAAIEYLVNEGISALIITPINSRRIAEKIKLLREEGIYTVCMNSDIEDSARGAYIGCDYKKSGALAAQLTHIFTGGTGTAAVILGSREIAGHCKRLEGFLSLCEQEYKGIRPDIIEENRDDDEYCFEIVRDILQNSSPRGIFFAAGGTSGGIRAVREYTGERPVIIACDETAPAVEALREGIVSAIISQQPELQGYKSVMTAFDAAVNNIFPPREQLYTKNEIILKYNI